MRVRLIALFALGCALSGVSAVPTHDVPTAPSDAKHANNDGQKFKIARSVSTRSTARTASNHNIASTLRGSSRAAAAFTIGDGRILKEDDNAGNNEEKNGQGQVEECDKDCEKARKEDEKAKEKAEKEAEKAAEDAAKAAKKAAEDAAKAAEKENADVVPEESPAVVEESIADEPETIAQDTTTTTTTPNEEKPAETTTATVFVEDETSLVAPTGNTDGQNGAADEETPTDVEKEEPEAAGTDGPFVVVVPPTSVKEDLGDDNKAVLPPPTEDNTIFDAAIQDEVTTTTTILENEGSGISSQNNKPTVVDVSINNSDRFPGTVQTDTDSGLTFSSNSSSSSANDGGLQPVGKALLSVALAGVFIAFVAVFLLQRQRRSSSSDPANALAIAPYSPSKDDSYFVDRDESYEDSSDVEKQIVAVDTAASSPAPTPEEEDHEDVNDDADAANDESDVEDEESQPASLSFSKNASKLLSMLPCQIDISPCSKPSMLEASIDDSTSVPPPPPPPDLQAVAAPSTSEMEEEESEENFTRNNTARELMRKYKMDDVSVDDGSRPLCRLFSYSCGTTNVVYLLYDLVSNLTSFFIFFRNWPLNTQTINF